MVQDARFRPGALEERSGSELSKEPFGFLDFAFGAVGLGPIHVSDLVADACELVVEANDFAGVVRAWVGNEAGDVAEKHAVAVEGFDRCLRCLVDGRLEEDAACGPIVDDVDMAVAVIIGGTDRHAIDGDGVEVFEHGEGAADGFDANVGVAGAQLLASWALLV